MFFFLKLCQLKKKNYLAVPGLVAVQGILDSSWHVGSFVMTCGSQFPDQGLNPGPVHGLSHWTTRGSPRKGDNF